MQSLLVLLLLCFFSYLLFPPLHTLKKNNQDCEKTLKSSPQDKPLLGTSVNQTSPSATQ